MTHQRWVIYRNLAGTEQHPTPEETFEQVRKEIPSISLATIYKNIKTFLEAGLLREVSTPDQTMRLDANLDSHHHLVCASCGKILDIPEESVAPVQLNAPLEGFRVESYNVSFLGHCGQCMPPAQASS
jgi:Fur family peroxide stress response transcriptional regulator